MGKMAMKRGLNTLGDSYYLQIGGVKYDRALFNELKVIDRKGVCTEAQARKIWDDVLDGPVLPTPTEIRTLRYGLRNYKFAPAARAFLLSKLPSSGGGGSSMKMKKSSGGGSSSMKAVKKPMAKAMKMSSMKMKAAPAPMKAAPAPMKSMKAPMKMSVMKAPMKMAVMKAAPAPQPTPALPTISKQPSKKQEKEVVDYIKKIFKRADVNGDGQLTLKEFKNAATGSQKKKLITAHVSKVGKKNNFATIKSKK